MAKKKTEGETPKSDPLVMLRSEIEKKWGKGVMVSASTIMDEPQQVIPIGPALDGTLSGGIPEGTWVSISGPPKVGKTSSMLSFAAVCQRPEYGSRRIHYFNVERRLKRKNIGGILGLDLHPDRFLIYESNKEVILTGKDHLEMAIHVLQTDPGAVVILDSVSALVESAVMEEGLGTVTRGGGAKMVSQFIDIVASVVPVQKSIVLGVTHLISDTSGRTMGGKVEKAANRWLYQADVRLKATWAEAWTVGGGKDGEGGKEIGKKVHWVCQESALGPPGMKCVSYLRYGVGVDRVYEVLEMGRAAGLITQAGSWLTLAYLEKHSNVLVGQPVPKALGGEKLYSLLASHPEWVKTLQDEVMTFLRGEDQGT